MTHEDLRDIANSRLRRKLWQTEGSTAALISRCGGYTRVAFRQPEVILQFTSYGGPPRPSIVAIPMIDGPGGPSYMEKLAYVLCCSRSSNHLGLLVVEVNEFADRIVLIAMRTVVDSRCNFAEQPEAEELKSSHHGEDRH